MITRLMLNITVETPLRDRTPNPEATAHFSRSKNLFMMSWWMGFYVQEKKMWMVVGQAGATFHCHPETAAQFASSSKE